MYLGNTRTAGRPCVRPSVTLSDNFQMVEKYFEDGSKKVGIDVTLHAEFDFNIIFDRLCVEMGQRENNLFAYGFLKDLVR